MMKMTWKTFASVFVSEGYEGNITITAYDDEAEDDIVFFNKNLNDMVPGEDTYYQISLNNLTGLDTFKDIGTFKIAFITFDEEDSDEVGSKEYDVNCDEDVLTFSECGDDPGGDKIDLVFVESANVIANDTVIFIPKESLSDMDVDDEFVVGVVIDQSETSHYLNLSKLESNDEGYFISALDLLTPDEVGESAECDFVVSFYKGGRKSLL